MQFSEMWLREWVNPAIDSFELAEQITMAGLEVDGIEPVAGRFTGVVVGQVMECRKHHNADKLWITKVNISGARLLDIVCGAPNCRTDLRVAVATVGALMPGGGTITATTLRGAPSEGMLCSFAELGIIAAGGDHNSIIELPADAPIGHDIRAYMQLEDTTFNISVTPNRADCFCLLGIARDVAVRNQISLKQPIINTVSPVIGDILPIHVNATDACPHYLGRVVKNINIGASTPLWMKEKLRRCGLKSVDVVVDITNYVLLELGQPIHVFDQDSIEGGIVVRHARHGETLTLLDGSNITLSPDTLVIADYAKVLAMAGIVGGIASNISQHTSNIVLACAFFQPVAIIGRARRYGLYTDASCRYERGVDPKIQPRAIERTTALLVSICSGQPGPVIEVTSTRVKQPVHITLRRKTLDRLIGHVIPDETVRTILTQLGCQVNPTTDGWQALVPSWRFDMIIEVDLVEEVARIYGYDAIPNISMRADLVISHHSETKLPLSRVKTLLVDRGYQEVITYSFVDPKHQVLLYPKQTPLVLPHPISQDMSVMRLSLWTGLLNAVVYNQHRQQQLIRLFESGFRFVPDHKADLGIRQDLMLAGVLAGPRFNEHWDQSRLPVDFFDAKGDLEAILELTGKLDDMEFRVQRHPALHPGQSAAIYLQNETIGFIGVINPALEAKLSLNSRTIVFELLWEKISERKMPKSHNISRFPANRRDIAVLVADDIAAADIIAECKKSNLHQIVSVNLFDVYRGRGVAKGFKSLAISLILQDTARTLEEDEIAATVTKCVEVLQQQFQASLRD